MRAHSTAVLFVLILIPVFCMPASAERSSGLKINPDAVLYPLTKGGQYPSYNGDAYQMSFGVRRWLKPQRMDKDLMFEQTMAESTNWTSRYGGYGVLGHGEDVFTRKGAALRRSYRIR